MATDHHLLTRKHGQGTSPSKLIALLTLLPLGGTLFFIAGLTLIATFIGLALATPLFIICSPVLVPAALAIGLSLTGFLGSGAMGLTALTSLSWVYNYIRGKCTAGALPEQVEHAKRRMPLIA